MARMSIRGYFGFDRLGTGYRREILAGVSTFLTIVLMSFTYNIGVGMTAGLVSYPLLKVVTGRPREVPSGLWVLSAIALGFYFLYPHG